MGRLAEPAPAASTWDRRIVEYERASAELFRTLDEADERVKRTLAEIERTRLRVRPVDPWD